MQWRRINGLGDGFLLLVLFMYSVACKLPEPELPTSGTPSINTSSTSTISASSPGTTTLTAPQIVSPTSGSEVAEPRPTLVVANATASDGSIPAYAFQVGANSSFSDIVASTEGIAQGSNGQTSWQVPRNLEPGRYFWRAQALLESIAGPPSSAADFRIRTSSESQPPQGRIVISDDLVNGSMGEVHGGRFIPQGWQVISKTDYIRYEVPPIMSGFVEWENMNLSSTNMAPDNHMLFGMWDPTKGSYRANPFRVHVQKLDTNHNPPYIRLRWIANGEENDEGFNFLQWNPQRTYQWRVEWGSEGESNSARVSVDGQVIIRIRYGPAYLLDVHYIELGVGERHESVVGAVYRNLRIGRN